jgi:tetratricopeptide (TPR) repeat protein
MKPCLVVVLALLLAVPFGMQAAGPDDEYVQVFNLIQEADSISTTQPERALAKYREAQTALLKFQKANPNWSPSVVSFRLDYLTSTIAGLSGKVPPPAASPPPATTPPVTSAPTPAPPPPVAAQPAKAAAPDDWQDQLNSLKDQVRQLQGDKSLLEAKLKEAFSARPAESDPRELARAEETVKTLQKENDLLKVSVENQKSKNELEAANKPASSRKGKAPPAATQELESQVASLRARLDVLEARSVPYSAEELALLKTPETKLPETPAKTSERPISELSPGLALLVSQAKSYYQAGQYDKAETCYSQVARQSPNNVPVLTDLASIQLQANHLEAADTTIKQAIALAPNSAYVLSVLGRLRLRESKFDDAFDALSRAAKLEPTNAEIQNFLGLTLSEKGLRGPAEAALRKAIELDPKYAVAHNNLAVVYVTGQPPAVELARWHYQRALAAGAPRNPELEKLLDAKH